ncbi:glycoside hydrolase, partial [bacterium]|nr:glycoside hydrolase [bacterium]
IIAEYYEGSWKSLPNFDSLKIVSKELVSGITLMPDKSFSNYALRFKGFLRIPEDGIYIFYSKSNDGSAIYIDNKKIVDNDGVHSAREKSGSIALQAGLHLIRIEFFQAKTGQALQIMWQPPGAGKSGITEDLLFH